MFTKLFTPVSYRSLSTKPHGHRSLTDLICALTDLRFCCHPYGQIALVVHHPHSHCGATHLPLQTAVMLHRYPRCPAAPPNLFTSRSSLLLGHCSSQYRSQSWYITRTHYVGYCSSHSISPIILTSSAT
jgi:hypothetical protein